MITQIVPLFAVLTAADGSTHRQLLANIDHAAQAQEVLAMVKPRIGQMTPDGELLVGFDVEPTRRISHPNDAESVLGFFLNRLVPAPAKAA